MQTRRLTASFEVWTAL